MGRKRTDSTTHRRRLELRKVELRVLDARALGAIAGGDPRDPAKTKNEYNRGASRYCVD